MIRHKFQTRTIVLVGEPQRALAVAMIENAPIGIEVVAREPVKARKLDQNALMWVGPLADMAAQAWVDGKLFSAEVWHEHFKREYLPEEDASDIHEIVKDPFKWRKWDYTPSGERVLIGSTTQLTVKGFSDYMEQVYAYGASIGVKFTEGRMR